MKLSVAIITYNQERFVAQAIESVLAQKVGFEYEIVIGDDCSTDGTGAIVSDFSRRYPNRIVALQRKRNLGALENFRGTLAACRGQYLALLEGDDYWTCTDKLQKQVDFLDEHPDHVISCHRAQILDEINKGWNGIEPNKLAGSYRIEDLFERNWLITCSVVYRWGSMPTLPDWFHKMGMGDWPLHVLVARSGRINLMDDVMATYRVHPGGLWSSRPPTQQLLEITKMLSGLDEYLDFQYTQRIRHTIALSYFKMACYARQNGNRMEVGKYFLNCIRNGGWQLENQRAVAGLAAYTLIGSWYKVFSRAKSESAASGASSR